MPVIFPPFASVRNKPGYRYHGSSPYISGGGGGNGGGDGGGGGPDPLLWVPSDDPDAVFWYEADSYRQDTVSGFSRTVPQDKLINAEDRELVHINAPTGLADLCQLDTTTYPFPVFVFQGKGIKTVAEYQFEAMDLYMVCRIITPGGHTSRYADHDYGNGWWIGTGNVAGTRGGGVRYGSNPYGAFETPALSASPSGWFLLQLMRGYIDPDAFTVILNSDDQGRRVSEYSDANITNLNPIAIGSDLGGNSGVPSMHVAAFVGYSSVPAQDGGRPGEQMLKRQGYLGHRFSSIKDAILLYDGSGTHPYWNSWPPV